MSKTRYIIIASVAIVAVALLATSSNRSNSDRLPLTAQVAALPAGICGQNPGAGTESDPCVISYSKKGVTFSWSEVSGATQYEGKVLETESGNLIQEIIPQTSTNFTLSASDIPQDGQFYWFVRARAGERTSPYSERVYLKVTGVPALIEIKEDLDLGELVSELETLLSEVPEKADLGLNETLSELDALLAQEPVQFPEKPAFVERVGNAISKAANAVVETAKKAWTSFIDLFRSAPKIEVQQLGPSANFDVDFENFINNLNAEFEGG